ncbi:MAG: molybdopterin-dependent oxidoreductase, partial [Deltaproteobacteria bacterium]|nr:molybdopterin-dependent oxidoreductase [Deltaproteobacteria bacterium]
MGVSCWGYYSGGEVGHNVSGVFLKLNENGTAQLITGAADIGQGLTTILCQIAAEELGISMDKVQMSPVDTDSAPIDLGSWLSRATYFTGNAVIEAAKDAKRQIFEIASEILDANTGDLISKDNVIYDSTNPEKSISIGDAIRSSIFTWGKDVLGRGYFSADLGP